MKKSSKDILIASGILFVLLLLGGAVVYFWVVDLRPPSKSAPEITAVCERYGDDHQFGIKVEGFGKLQKGKRYPSILEEKGKAPEQYPNYEEEDEI